MKFKKTLNIIAQIALPTLTIGAQVATAMKYPEF